MTIRPKYRRLSQVELEDMEQAFVRFLATHSITADDWQAMKKRDLEKVEDLIIRFSDHILEDLLTKIHLVVKRSSHRIELYKVGQEKVVMYALQAPPDLTVDWTTDDIDLSILSSQRSPSQIIRAEKSIGQSPQHETFTLLQQGAMVSKNEKLYKTLEKMSQSRQSQQSMR